MGVIELEHLSYAYPPLVPGGPTERVLHDVHLTVERGECLALMGPTGAGKTTLCMAMNGLVPRSTGGVFGGRAVVLGHDTRRTPVPELARHVGIVFQDAESQLFSPTVEDELAFGPENLGVPREEIAERVEWALALVGVAPLRNRPPARLSGGQKQRVAIAAALTLLPEILILDEPTASLDPLGQRQVSAAIEALASEQTMTIVLASQDPEQVAEFADRVAILWQGRIARVDEPRRVFADGDLLAVAGLAPPQVTDVARRLRDDLGCSPPPVRFEEAVSALSDALRRRRGAP